MATELVVFDIAGTLIEDHDEVTSAFHEAFQKNGIAVTHEQLREWKGGAKREVIRKFAAGDEALVEKTFADFRLILEAEYVKSLTPIAGAEATVRELRADGIKTATISGFYREVRDAIVDRLGWRELFDAHISSDDVEHGRPAPDMILRAMKIAVVADARRVLVVGDTPLDLQAANNAGAVAVAVLTGVHPRVRLEREKHDYIIESVADLPHLVHTYF
jgi:phosphonatase-like hydrolase